MDAMPIVTVRPAGQFYGFGILYQVAAVISPVREGLLHEVLGLVIGLRRIRFRADALEAKVAEGIP
jgi:hypothetical protein